MSSNAELFEAVRVRLKLRGEWPPPKLCAEKRIQKWTVEKSHNVLDLNLIIKESRQAGATLAEVTKFSAQPHDLQVEELLTSRNTAEPQLAEDEEQEYLAQQEKRRARWLTEKDLLNKNLKHRREQSDRDKAPGSISGATPNKRQRKKQLSSIAYSPTKPNQADPNLLLGTDGNNSPRPQSTAEWIEEQKRKGRERKLRNLTGESLELGVDNCERKPGIQEALRASQMSPSPVNKAASENHHEPKPANHPPLVDRTRAKQTNESMDPSKDSGAAAELNHEIEKNVEANTAAAAPAEVTNKPKKEKAPKQPKAPKATPSTAPLTPAVIDLRVGHILRAIEHPNADTMYVSTIAMGDAEGAEHTEIDEQTGKVVRTVCSGLKAYVKLEDMQDRKIVVVANLKPANLRSIKSAAMVLAASPKPEEGADPHSPDRTVELVQPPAGSEAGDKVYFEGWPYGDGKGPEKQLNPKKKMWEMLQPGFYTTDDLVVAFDASKSEMEDKSGKGELVVEGKGKCTVASLKGAIVR